MLFLALFTLFSSLVLASQSKFHCERELATIAYAPQTQLQQYLNKISHELTNIAEIWNTPQGVSLVENFTVKYGTVVAIVDAFGNILVYFDGQLVDSVTPSTRGNVYSSRDARCVMNLGAFANEMVIGVYSFLSFSRDGHVYEITVGRPKLDIGS